MRSLLLLVAGLTILLCGRIHGQPCDCRWPTDVIILHVNDMHSGTGRMAKLAYLADSLGRTCKHVMVVSAGDRFVSGDPNVKGTVLEPSKPYIRKRAGNGNRIVFLGLGLQGPGGMITNDPVGPAREFAIKKDREVLIGLSTLGKEQDIEIARQIPQFDLIIGGKGCDRLDTGMTVNGVLITRAGCDLEYAGKTFLRLDRGRVVYRSEELIRLDSLSHSD